MRSHIYDKGDSNSEARAKEKATLTFSLSHLSRQTSTAKYIARAKFVREYRKKRRPVSVKAGVIYAGRNKRALEREKVITAITAKRHVVRITAGRLTRLARSSEKEVEWLKAAVNQVMTCPA